MKRIFPWILLLAVLCALTGCGTEEAQGTGASASETSAICEELTPAPTQAITFDEVIAVDNEFCAVRITGIEEDTLFGYTIKVHLENKSTDTTYMFSVESAAINGVKADPFFASEVAPGKKANEEILFTESFGGNDIGPYTDIALSLRVYDSNDWTADPVAEETVHIYPLGENQVAIYQRASQATDTVIAENEAVTVIVTGYREDAIWGYSADLYLVNKTDREIMFSVDEASVNGYMAEPLYVESVASGTCAFSSISWSDSTLEENGITEVKNIEFLLRAYDAEDWAADDFFNEVITLNP